MTRRFFGKKTKAKSETDNFFGAQVVIVYIVIVYSVCAMNRYVVSSTLFKSRVGHSFTKPSALDMKVTCLGLKHAWFVCLFWVYHPTREFFTHMQTSPLPLKGCKFWPWWPLSSEGSLAWHGESVYNGNIRGPVTVTPTAERLAVELLLPVFTT